MKKYLLLFILGIQIASAKAEKDTLHSNPFQRFHSFFYEDDCDACGCSASGGGMGFSSMLNPNFVGLRYMRQSYTSRDGLF